ncbi:MAG: ATP-binding protein [Thermoguttaceae bacterium]|jgi:signal transduction histidine kinase
MSYKSLKRALGETSLERKCRFLFGTCLFLLISASFWAYDILTERVVYEQNQIRGQLLVDRAIQARHVENLASILNIFRKNDKSPPSEKDQDSMKSDASLIQDITTLASKQKFEWSFIWANSTDASNRPQRGKKNEKYEYELLEKYKNKPSPGTTADSDVPEFDEGPPEDDKYIYYQAIRAERSCLICHVAPPGGVGIDMTGTGLALGGLTAAHEGDLLAIAKVTIPNGPMETKLNFNRAILMATAIVTVILAMFASYLIVRYVIVKPLRHLRDVSDAISRGDISQRADIHTGDEFEELAVAFNRMLRHLTTIQEELRQVNANLDGKVDELAQVNMRLYELNMLKSDFLATMSHELRTPLNSILGFSEVLESIDSLDEKQKRYVQNIQKSGRTLLDMINDILDLAKIESGKMDTRVAEFHINHVIAAQCDMARPLSEKKNIDLQVNIQPGLPPMRQDQARVQQILNNLLSNAIKFTPEGGWITVSAERDDKDYLVLRVSDTGVGIAEEDRQAIFEKFRQGRTAMPTGEAITREHSGTGLGLSIVKELCKLLGGEISVDSELGKGSTFTVRLPWTLQEQPRLDSALIEGFNEFAKSRLDLIHHERQTAE